MAFKSDLLVADTAARLDVFGQCAMFSRNDATALEVL